MRRLLLASSVALVLAAAACSSSEPEVATSTTTSAPSSGGTTSVVVSEANEAACDALGELAALPTPTPSSDPVASATAIQTYLSSARASLDAAKAGAPSDLQPDFEVVVVGIDTALALNPNVAADQQQIGVLVLNPPQEVKTARGAISDWAATNCGLDVLSS